MPRKAFPVSSTLQGPGSPVARGNKAGLLTLGAAAVLGVVATAGLMVGGGGNERHAEHTAENNSATGVRPGLTPETVSAGERYLGEPERHRKLTDTIIGFGDKIVHDANGHAGQPSRVYLANRSGDTATLYDHFFEGGRQYQFEVRVTINADGSYAVDKGHLHVSSSTSQQHASGDTLTDVTYTTDDEGRLSAYSRVSRPALDGSGGRTDYVAESNSHTVAAHPDWGPDTLAAQEEEVEATFQSDLNTAGLSF